MAGGERGEPQRAEFDRLAELHFAHPMARAEAMLVEAGGGGRGERELVSGDVVGVGVGDEGAGLATADVDRELGAGQEEAVVVMEHLSGEPGQRAGGRGSGVS